MGLTAFFHCQLTQKNTASVSKNIYKIAGKKGNNKNKACPAQLVINGEIYIKITGKTLSNANADKGSFGSVHIYENPITGHKIAVKEIKIGDDSQSGESPLDRVIQEHNIAKKFNQSFALLVIYRSGKNKPGKDKEEIQKKLKACIIMPYHGKNNLHNAIKEKLLENFSFIDFLCSMYQLLQQGRLLELRGYVHRDIKPENIMLTEDGDLILIDYGLAKKLTKCKSKKVVGAPLYLAPETVQCVLKQKNSFAWSNKIDSFAMDIILLELLTKTNYTEELLEEFAYGFINLYLKKHQEITKALFKRINQLSNDSWDKQQTKQIKIILCGMLAENPKNRFAFVEICKKFDKFFYEYFKKLNESQLAEFKESTQKRIVSTVKQQETQAEYYRIAAEQMQESDFFNIIANLEAKILTIKNLFSSNYELLKYKLNHYTSQKSKQVFWKALYGEKLGSPQPIPSRYIPIKKSESGLYQIKSDIEMLDDMVDRLKSLEKQIPEKKLITAKQAALAACLEVITIIQQKMYAFNNELINPENFKATAGYWVLDHIKNLTNFFDLSNEFKNHRLNYSSRRTVEFLVRANNQQLPKLLTSAPALQK